MSEECSCAEKSDLRATIQIHCASCRATFDKIEIKKPVKVISVTAFAAYAASLLFTYAINDNRYPLTVEYEILESCTKSSTIPLSSKQYGIKKERCLCALEDTMNEVSYTRYLVDEGGFINSFKDNAKECKK